MKAGTELDALVAEKVMGWEIWRHENINEIDVILDDETFSINEFKPSTDIKDAWEVVEFISANIGGIELTTACDEDRYYLKIWNGKKHIEAKAKTAPLAICLAALKAVGVEVLE